MQYSNAQILSAVLNKYMQPLVNTLAMSKLQAVPFVQGIENKVKSMGWVSSNWSIVSELAPYTEAVSASLIGPILTQYISNIPDEAIPELAHGIVDKAILEGELKLIDGYISFDKHDLDKLKTLLNINLPLSQSVEGYIVIEA